MTKSRLILLLHLIGYAECHVGILDQSQSKLELELHSVCAGRGEGGGGGGGGGGERGRCVTSAKWLQKKLLLLRIFSTCDWNCTGHENDKPVFSVSGRRAASAEGSCWCSLAFDLLRSLFSNICWMRHSCLSRSGKWNSVPDCWQIMAKSKTKRVSEKVECRFSVKIWPPKQ